VWHGHYAKYFEIGRTALFRLVDLDLATFADLGLGIVVIETRHRYVYPLTYGDRFRVDSWFGDIDHRLLVVQEIVNLTAGRRAVRGRTAMVVTDANGSMHLETPSAIRERILNRAGTL
jgi:acyl-CoA thioester hydrolase